MDTVGRQIIEEERGRSKGQEWVKEEEKVVEGGGGKGRWRRAALWGL